MVRARKCVKPGRETYEYRKLVSKQMYRHLPEEEISFQLMEGSGLPLAWHIRVTLEPSFTMISLDKLMIFGGTVGENENKYINNMYSLNVSSP